MHKHQTLLGGVFLGFGILHVVAILVLLAIFGFGSAVLFTVADHEPTVPEFVKFIPVGFGLLISVLVALTAIPNLIAAYGLFKNRPWAMSVALIVGIWDLLHFPMGTAAGIYAIWVWATHKDVTQRPVVL